MEYTETASLEDAIASVDVLYMTRIQRERFSDAAEYERLKDSYVLDLPKMAIAKEDMIVLHPLPRVNEISVKVDNDKRACYFKQALCGKYMRMALILKLLSENDKKKNSLSGEENESLMCKNPACITQVERGIKHLYKGDTCIYCDHKAERK